MRHKYNLKDYKFKHLGQNLLLHPYKSIFWKEKQILFISDLHFGKATHFRKGGIPIPEEVHEQDFIRMELLVKHYKPARIIFLGDLFHSEYNHSWQSFKHFIEFKIGIKPELVVGNHDVLQQKEYAFMNIYIDHLIIEPFILTHEPLDNKSDFKLYNLCGHLHPSISIKGSARQSFRVECFYFSKKHGILPAFGNFTGTSKLPVRLAEDQIFAIAENEVIPLY
jgi:DNA ligase-associated metallophosphoesterase